LPGIAFKNVKKCPSQGGRNRQRFGIIIGRFASAKREIGNAQQCRFAENLISRNTLRIPSNVYPDQGVPRLVDRLKNKEVRLDISEEIKNLSSTFQGPVEVRMDKLSKLIRNIPDFPKPGIQFKDITPLLADAECFHEAIDALRNRHAGKGIDMVVGIEARGFIFSSALAYALEAGTCLVRKTGKLPDAVHRLSYELEYGTDALEIHADALQRGQKILIIDDVLATGGTVCATAEMISRHFAVDIVELDFLIELEFLEGRKKLNRWPVYSLLQYA
jgi:adenine phosphoribosyltransferase